MRIVEFEERKIVADGIKKTLLYGNFIQYGINFEDFEDGIGNYSSAIIEMPDGTVKNLAVEKIRFIDKIEKRQP